MALDGMAGNSWPILLICVIEYYHIFQYWYLKKTYLDNVVDLRVYFFVNPEHP